MVITPRGVADGEISAIETIRTAFVCAGYAKTILQWSKGHYIRTQSTGLDSNTVKPGSSAKNVGSWLENLTSHVSAARVGCSQTSECIENARGIVGMVGY